MPQLDFMDTFLLILNYTVTNIFVFIFFIFYFFCFNQNFKFNIYFSFLNMFYFILGYTAVFHFWVLKLLNRTICGKLPMFSAAISINFFIFSPLEQFESDIVIFIYFVFFVISFLVYFRLHFYSLFSRAATQLNNKFPTSKEREKRTDDWDNIVKSLVDVFDDVQKSTVITSDFLGYFHRVKVYNPTNPNVVSHKVSINSKKPYIDDIFYSFSEFLGLLKLNVSTSHFQVFIFWFYFFFCLLISTTSNIVICFGTSSLTENIFTCFLYSVIVNFGILLIGLGSFGIYFLNFFLPGGSPSPLFFFLVLVETISYFMRFFSLAIRIFANMVSGGILMKILLGFSAYLFGLASTASFGGGILLIIAFFVLFLEFFVAGLQAYVFVFLSIVYLNEILHIGSH